VIIEKKIFRCLGLELFESAGTNDQNLHSFVPMNALTMHHALKFVCVCASSCVYVEGQVRVCMWNLHLFVQMNALTMRFKNQAVQIDCFCDRCVFCMCLCISVTGSIFHCRSKVKYVNRNKQTHTEHTSIKETINLYRLIFVDLK